MLPLVSNSWFVDLINMWRLKPWSSENRLLGKNKQIFSTFYSLFWKTVRYKMEVSYSSII